jgi:OOP family OmpA-OmpF porin
MLPLLAAKWRFIEADVASNVSADLQSINASWANVETLNRGRHVLITGSPLTQEAINQARELAESSRGVDEVTLSANVKAPPQFAELSSIIRNDKIQLNGVVSSQSELDSLVSQAQKAFGTTSVENRLTIGNNTAQLPNSGTLFSLLATSAKSSDELRISIKQNILNIEGNIKSKDVKNRLESDLNRIYIGQVNSDLHVPPIKLSVCQDLVNGLLNNRQIIFESAKAVISSDSYELLKSIKSIADRCPSANFEITGHTDSLGKLALNMSLSQARAEAVLNHLVRLGLKVSRLNAVGYGPNQPIADNSNENGRALNRRIEFKIKN